MRVTCGATAALLLLAPAIPETEVRGGQASRAGPRAGLHAQASGFEDVPDPRRMRHPATPRQGSIAVDGRLDEAGWERAEIATGFIQQEPDEGQPAREQTEVRVLYDSENVYVGARMWDSDPSSIARQLTRRDEGGRAYDYFQVSFDSNLDRRSGYTFRITAAGAQVDRFHPDDTGTDENWDAIWDSAVRVDGRGWTAELRIPLSQLRFTASAEPQTWGVNFGRRKISTNERSDWAWTPRGVPGNVSRFGQLVGLLLPERHRYLEVVPYAMSGVERRPAEPGDPFFDGGEARSRAGADVRYGLGSTFVLDAALNPDFGHVEVDPRVINLTAFETFYPERRPFFSRDDGAFAFSLPGSQNTLFHSRRIGRSPQGSAPSGADHVSVQSEATILGAAKVTGRTSRGLTVGVLGALTDHETGRAWFAADDRFERFTAEPRTGYGAVRIQQDLRGSRSRVGGILTGVGRELPADGSLDYLARSAITGGLDFEHSWADREWAVWGLLAGSRVGGDETALLRLQRSPSHYYQRPDQEYLTLDPRRTSLSGAEWRLQLEKRGGRHWTGAVWAGQRTPGFEVNDLGYSTASERLDGGARIAYRELTPGDVLRDYEISLSAEQSWRHSVLDHPFTHTAWGEAHKAGAVEASAGFTFLDWSGLNLGVSYQPEILDDVLTRGGPLMIRPAVRSFQVRGNTDRRRSIGWDAFLGYDDGLRGGHAFTAQVGMEARPANGLLFSLGPSYRRSHDIDQYVLQVTDELFTPTFGVRYWFADLDREQLSMDTRMNLIFSPKLSFQLFAQPLLSAGDYVAYKQLARPASFDFLRFERGEVARAGGETACAGGNLCRDDRQVYVDYDGDGRVDDVFPERSFNIRSLRGSAVLRWEYRPGSRVYLVWQQRRQGREPFGVFDLGRDARALLDARPENVLMIKATYWLDL